MPNIIGNDGYVRRIYPAQGVGSHLKVSTARLSKAYCEECGTEFRAVESKLQIEDWKAHSCDTTKLRKFEPKNKT